MLSTTVVPTGPNQGTGLFFPNYKHAHSVVFALRRLWFKQTELKNAKVKLLYTTRIDEQKWARYFVNGIFCDH